MSARLLSGSTWHVLPVRRGPASVGRGVAEAWRRWTTRRLLRELDDQLLKDIGVTRYEARIEADKPFWRG